MSPPLAGATAVLLLLFVYLRQRTPLLPPLPLQGRVSIATQPPCATADKWTLGARRTEAGRGRTGQHFPQTSRDGNGVVFFRTPPAQAIASGVPADTRIHLGKEAPSRCPAPVPPRLAHSRSFSSAAGPATRHWPDFFCPPHGTPAGLRPDLRWWKNTLAVGVSPIYPITGKTCDQQARGGKTWRNGGEVWRNPQDKFMG